MTDTATTATPSEGAVVWIEIPAVDVKECKAFYASLFPAWTFPPLPAAYDAETLALFEVARPEGLHGGIVQVSPSCKGAGPQKNGVGATVVYSVGSIEETQKRILELGGATVQEKTQEGENGWYAKYHDTEGNVFGIYEVRRK